MAQHNQFGWIGPSFAMSEYGEAVAAAGSFGSPNARGYPRRMGISLFADALLARVPELRRELRQRGVDHHGNRDVLRRRFRDHLGVSSPQFHLFWRKARATRGLFSRVEGSKAASSFFVTTTTTTDETEIVVEII